jgi:CHASE2 domain-containing sensor protein
MSKVLGSWRVSSPEPCKSKYSLSFKLAQKYLEDEGIKLTIANNNLKLGKVVFNTLESNSGGYHNIDAKGHQILLNYRASAPVAQTVTLQQFLSYQFDLALVKNRIVIIGTIAPSFNDHHWYTPYSRRWGRIETITGVEMQAHMVSQILSAVLDGRSLLWYLPKPLEIFWIGVWAFASGLAVRHPHSVRYTTLKVSLVIVVLYGSCFGLLITLGAWFPLLPATLASVFTTLSVAISKLAESGSCS